MTAFSMFLIAFFLLISWLLCLEAYHGTERDLPHVHPIIIISPQSAKNPDTTWAATIKHHALT